MSTSLTRVVTFHARHRYHKPEWSEAKNRERFGSAGALPSHGHLYRIAVTITGPLDGETQMVMDLAAFDTALQAEIVAPLGGEDLTLAVPEFADGAQLPTCEALAQWCWKRLATRLPDTVRLARVRVAEDDTLWADVTGPT